MDYAVAALLILIALTIAGRLASRRFRPATFPASELLRRDPPVLVSAHAVSRPATQGITVKLQVIPGAPNTDPPTDRHVTDRGTATIRRRTGRRRSTTSV